MRKPLNKLALLSLDHDCKTYHFRIHSRCDMKCLASPGQERSANEHPIYGPIQMYCRH